MKQILRTLFLIVCTWIFTHNTFAAIGIRTIVKGSIQGINVKRVKIYKRESARGFKVVDSLNSNGQFQLQMNLTIPGFYVLTSDAERLFELEMYLNPGDQITLEMNNGQVMMAGKGGGLNQFLYENNKKTYDEQLNAIENVTSPELVRNKAVLLGNAQGSYLDKVFGPVLESKIHAENAVIKEVALTDLDIQLVPEIMVYPNWRQTITELMYAKMKAGQLKIGRAETWLADFGKAIENQKLKEAYITATLSYSVSSGDLATIQKEIKACLPLIKNRSNLIRINALKPKIVQGMSFFKNALPGTDMSRFSFQNVKGETVSIKDYRGKLIYIDIWNTGCKPCIAEMPYLKNMEHDLAGSDIVFLSVSCDYDIELWKGFLQRHNMSGEQLIMTGKKDTFFDKIGKGGIPRFVILDKEGKMIDYNSAKRPSNPILKIYLTELLNQSPL